MSPGLAAQLACILEVTAPKAGNVHPGASFDDLDATDFLLAAAAIAAPMERAATLGVGPTILESIRATRSVVSTNANLGIVLLLAPLAALGDGPVDRAALRLLLESTTVDDARAAYEAIRLANPGGLGAAESQDVASQPTMILVEAMRLAASRDLVARQYANGYEQVFEIGLPVFREAIGDGSGVEQAVVSVHLALLGRMGDSLIERKCGVEISREAARRASAALASGEDSFRELDRWLRADGHRRNPGATADLVAAVLYVALQDGLVSLPRTHPATAS